MSVTTLVLAILISNKFDTLRLGGPTLNVNICAVLWCCGGPTASVFPMLFVGENVVSIYDTSDTVREMKKSVFCKKRRKIK